MFLASLNGQGRKLSLRVIYKSCQDGQRWTRNKSYKGNGGDWEQKLESLKKEVKGIKPDKDKAKTRKSRLPPKGLLSMLATAGPPDQEPDAQCLPALGQQQSFPCMAPGTGTTMWLEPLCGTARKSNLSSFTLKFVSVSRREQAVKQRKPFFFFFPSTFIHFTCQTN